MPILPKLPPPILKKKFKSPPLPPTGAQLSMWCLFIRDYHMLYPHQDKHVLNFVMMGFDVFTAKRITPNIQLPVRTQERTVRLRFDKFRPNH
ncbi:hypothetical protein BLNAU_17087 [Blattamonas nauphoetae]|uniref:Uncharacterized protein n=1 Tax=Blattamonas nauphoetae TaxID=2049346 RepID=A0ABQ9X7Q4_9EUKA|nr:hypothetical protein BLNAU_17087 [Blattamonas nauphoetae]